MLKKVFVLSAIVAFAVSVSGCATARKQSQMEIEGLRNQVSALEAQVQSKDEEINNLKEELAKAPEVKEKQMNFSGKRKVAVVYKSRPNIRQIQIALKNAGFEPGKIDGRMGKQTREAVIAFQKAHNLAANGKVGRKTWSLLREYLHNKLK